MSDIIDLISDLELKRTSLGKVILTRDIPERILHIFAYNCAKRALLKRSSIFWRPPLEFWKALHAKYYELFGHHEYDYHFYNATIKAKYKDIHHNFELSTSSSLFTVMKMRCYSPFFNSWAFAANFATTGGVDAIIEGGLEDEYFPTVLGFYGSKMMSTTDEEWLSMVRKKTFFAIKYSLTSSVNKLKIIVRRILSSSEERYSYLKYKKWQDEYDWQVNELIRLLTEWSKYSKIDPNRGLKYSLIGRYEDDE